MHVAAELVELGGYTQSAAANYAGVAREALNRALNRRKRERLATGRRRWCQQTTMVVPHYGSPLSSGDAPVLTVHQSPMRSVRL